MEEWHNQVPSLLKKRISVNGGVIDSNYTEVEFVPGRTEPGRMPAPSPLHRATPLNGIWWGVIFSIPCPGLRSSTWPTDTRDGSPLAMGGNNQGPILGMRVVGLRTGAGWPSLTTDRSWHRVEVESG